MNDNSDIDTKTSDIAISDPETSDPETRDRAVVSKPGASEPGASEPGDSNVSTPQVVDRLHIVPWEDPVVDATGYDPRGWYFERYWLGVIGPTATMVMRRLADNFDEHPDGFDLDLSYCASTMGLSFRHGASSPFGRALERCVMFGLARRRSDGLMVRRRAPRVAQRHLDRLPERARAAHPAIAATEHQRIAELVRDYLLGAGVAPPMTSRCALQLERVF